MFSGLRLLSSEPLNYTHSIGILLRYDPRHPDPSLVFRPFDMGRYTFAELEDAFTPGQPGSSPSHFAGKVLPPSRTAKVQKKVAALSKEWHTFPLDPDGRQPVGALHLTLVLIANHEDATGNRLHMQSMAFKMSQPDLEGGPTSG